MCELYRWYLNGLLTCVTTEVAAGEPCLYPGHCTFAYCEEEIDVWTLERKGFISRELLFDPFGSNGSIRLSVAKILQEHHGIFMFLCGVSVPLLCENTLFQVASYQLAIILEPLSNLQKQKKKSTHYIRWLEHSALSVDFALRRN